MDTIILILRLALILFIVAPLSLAAARYALRLIEADTTRQYMQAYAPVTSQTPPAAPRSKLKICRGLVAPSHRKGATAFRRKQDGRYFV